ncbi:hypothetical protein B0H11DRAFT_1915961 [Mycena galericulata]|nr:hypothetical protein B0H11DRAFT_1927776 [Mycena galericulata]KAJ7480215.1 hypothetical protein B0H11DRAFT_1915961 [Mycena galericulata]
MQVAMRVKEWVEPLLYCTIILSGDPRVDAPPLEGYPEFTTEILSSAMGSKPPAFFRNSVRDLLLFYVLKDKEILTVCTSVENLWIVGTLTGQFDSWAQKSLTLKHLYTNFVELLCGPPATRPIFPHLTHLELMGPTQADDDIDVLFSSRGVHTGVDYWSRAEGFIAMRQSGTIDRQLYMVPADPDEDEISNEADEGEQS